MNSFAQLVLILGLLSANPLVAQGQDQNDDSLKTQKPSTTKKNADEQKTVNLFDGSSLKGWKITEFGGEGECVAEDGILLVDIGYPMSGVTYTGKDLPKTNYELSLEARRTEGEDFFCGLTFPVDDSHCTFIAGGWGGTVTGLSCIDDADASNNNTRQVINYKINQWYKIKVRVEREKIMVWLDDKRIINQSLVGHKISVRNETRPCRPLGLCNYQTYSEFRNIRLTRLEIEKKAKQSIDPTKDER